MKPSNRTWRKEAAFGDFVFVLVPVLTDITRSGLESKGSIRKLSQSASLIGLLCPLILPSWIGPVAQVYAGG